MKGGHKDIRRDTMMSGGDETRVLRTEQIEKGEFENGKREKEK